MTDPFVRVRRLSRRMRHAVTITAALITLGVGAFMVMALVDPAAYRNGLAQGHPAAIPQTLTASAIVISLLSTAVQLGVLLAALWCIRRMFRALESEEPLSEEAARWMKRAAIAFLATALASVVLHTVTVLAVTYANPPGQRALSISVGSADLLALLIAGIMFMIGRVMAVAAEIRSDQRAFV